jgi:hypothetical protein
MTTIVLGISPRAAEALERRVKGEAPDPGDAALLELIHAELNSQLRNPTREAVVTHTKTTTQAQDVAAAMAAAGAAAITNLKEAA